MNNTEFDDGYRAAVRDVLWLAEGRDRYRDPSVQPQVHVASLIAAILGGAPDEAWGWLPSWLWDEWAARRASHVGAWADGEVKAAAWDEGYEAAAVFHREIKSKGHWENDTPRKGLRTWVPASAPSNPYAVEGSPSCMNDTEFGVGNE